VAQQLSMAIERAKQNEELDFKSTVAAATAWAADIAHDINKEVGRIRRWAYLAKENVEEDSKAYGYIKKVEERASMLSIGPWKNSEEQPLLLDSTIRKNMNNLVHDKNVLTELNLNCKGIYIKADPTAFERTLRQLVRNALQAMETSDNKKISIHTQRLGNNIEILFQDFGPGIQDTVRTSLLQKRITTQDRGGYGLLLTRQMVEDMGGKIKLLPYELGVGAKFLIKLPISDRIDK
jgi:signal transduction histidine kinase